MSEDVLAHAGGVPEALAVLVPLAVTVVLLRIGARRNARSGDRPPEDDVSS